MTVRRAVLFTVGGSIPCLSSVVGGLIQHCTEIVPDIGIIVYQYGYHGLLTGNYIAVGKEVCCNVHILSHSSGSLIGNSRVKLTNTKNLVERGLIKEGENPFEVTAGCLRVDDVGVLHAIGDDDTNTTVVDLATYLKDHGHELTAVGFPKITSNDIVLIRQSLGAWTAAEGVPGSAQHVISEHRSNPRIFIVHEVMSRSCGCLTVQSAQYYHARVGEQEQAPSFGLSEE